MSARRSVDAGLSLIEVIVSLAVFAVIGVAGLAILDSVARTGQRTEGRLERLAEIDRAFLVMRRDLAQITNDPVTLNSDKLAFQRVSAARKVAVTYLLNDTDLIRQIAVPSADAVDQPLLRGVAAAQWRVMDAARNWQTLWPPAGDTPEQTLIAAELTLAIQIKDASGTQTVTRLISLPAGQSR